MLQVVGETYGAPGLGLGDAGECELEIGDVLFAFFYVREPEALLINAKIADGKHLENRAEKLEQLLELCHIWQGTARGIIGLNPDDDVFYYSYKIPLPYTEEKDIPADFLLELLGYMNGAIEVARVIINPELEDEDKPTGATGAPQGMVDPGMMA
jgi:hypothetical protein